MPLPVVFPEPDLTGKNVIEAHVGLLTVQLHPGRCMGTEDTFVDREA